jgi:hypothetical protein
MKAKMTIAEFNAALAAQGMTMEVVKGSGYFYFAMLDPAPYDTESEMIYAWKHLTPAEWMERARDAWAAMNARA